jgi:hypothetical protein
MKAKDLITILSKNPEAEVVFHTDYERPFYPNTVVESVCNGAVSFGKLDKNGDVKDKEFKTSIILKIREDRSKGISHYGMMEEKIT